jgi:HK97 family phage prohead protease
MEIKEGCFIDEFKEIKKDNGNYGIVRGYLATWDVDQGKDQYDEKAFDEHLEEYAAKNKPIPLKNQHGNIVGGFPVDKIKKDRKGLYVEGEINLDVQEGRETYALVKQRVLDSFSTGYTAEEKQFSNGIRKIMKSKLWEGSVLPHPMNQAAMITEVKAYPNEHAARVKNPDLFESDSFRRKEIGNRGVIAIIGKLKGETTTTIQAYRFPKDKFTAEQAQKWLDDNDVKPIEFEAASKGMSVTELKNISKSDLVKIFKSANLSRDAANHVASIVMTDNLVNDSGNPVAMITALRDQIKMIKEKL